MPSLFPDIVGRIIVRYPTRLCSAAMVPTDITQSLRIMQFYFGIQKPWKIHLQFTITRPGSEPQYPELFQTPKKPHRKIALIRTILTVVHTSGSVHCRRRTGTCRVFVYTNWNREFSRPHTYYIPFESYSHVEFNAVGIVGNGSVIVEKRSFYADIG